MTLSYECVSQNYPQCVEMAIGSTIIVVDGIKTLEVKRLTEWHCKMRQIFT